MIMKFFLNSPKIGLLLISGLGINLSWLSLLDWSWNSAVTLMMTTYILKLNYNRHAVKLHIMYDLSLMGGSFLTFLALNYILNETLAISSMAAAIMASLWTWGAFTMLFNKMVPDHILHEFALGHKPT